MSISFKTVRGEEYSNCDILFGPEPVTVSEEELSEIVNRQGVKKTVQQWLTEDTRLKLVEVASTQEAPPEGGDGDNDPDRSPPEGAGDKNPDKKPEKEPVDKAKSKAKAKDETKGK